MFRDISNFGIGYSMCKHSLKLCGSLLDYLGGAMIWCDVTTVLCVDLYLIWPPLTVTSVDLYLIRAWRCCNFHDRFSSVRMNRTRTALLCSQCSALLPWVMRISMLSMWWPWTIHVTPMWYEPHRLTPTQYLYIIPNVSVRLCVAPVSMIHKGQEHIPHQAHRIDEHDP